MSHKPLVSSDIPGYPCRRGKVRDVYDLGESLVIVATDRISAFDWVLPTPIPDKGNVLTAMTAFWLKWLQVPHHLLSTEIGDLPVEFRRQRDILAGRTMLVRKTQVVPIECVARGYLAGSGLKEYRTTCTVCGLPLPDGLLEASPLPEPIFTPATKAEQGLHDDNISFEEMARQVGDATASLLRDRTLEIYRRAATYAEARGIILADTKLEWGQLPNGEFILIDEVLTPDSSRFWPHDTYQTGVSPPSFDKQFVRDWLEVVHWDKKSPPPEIPVEVVERTASKYREALQRLTAS